MDPVLFSWDLADSFLPDGWKEPHLLCRSPCRGEACESEREGAGRRGAASFALVQELWG